MMLLRALGIGPKRLSAQLRAKLPQLETFVDLVVLGGPKGSATFEELTEKTFTIQALPGLRAGQRATFSYNNDNGKFRFSARCSAVEGGRAIFPLPERIETVQAFTGTQQRAAVRLAATLPAQWRFAPGGIGDGDFMRGAIADISRTGASLIVDYRELRKGTFVEVKLLVSSSASPLLLLGEVMRSSKIETSGKVSLGLRFNGLSPGEDRAIMEFINKRQAERRSRGLA
jgi:c-di-GMP-binding flagellar brake protein YcgR